MKKIILFITLLSILLLIGCNNNDNRNILEFKTDENFISQIQKEINEPIEFIETKNIPQKLECEKKEYKFLLKNRNVEFYAYQIIDNFGPKLWYDTGRLWNNYKYEINYDDYFNAIRKSNHKDFCELAKKYNIEITEEYEIIVLPDLEENTIINLYNFLVEVQSFYDYKNKKDVNYNENFSICVKSDLLNTSLKDKQKSFWLGDYDIINFKQDFKNNKEFLECINNTYTNNIEYLENLYSNENVSILGQ